MADEFMRKLSEERATYQKLFSPETLPECASYRERQADELIKRMETVPEGSPAYKIYEPAATRYLLAKCILAEWMP
jgi:hypothetical protein